MTTCTVSWIVDGLKQEVTSLTEIYRPVRSLVPAVIVDSVTLVVAVGKDLKTAPFVVLSKTHPPERGQNM